MIKYFILFAILFWDATLALKFTEKKEVTTSKEKTFTCFYTIVYTDSLDKAKSKVTCTPDLNGGNAVETFYISENFGFVQMEHSVNKGKDKIVKLKKVDAPSTSQESNVPLGCTCKIPNPLMIDESMTAMGRAEPNTSLKHHGGYSGGSSGGGAGLALLLGFLVGLFVLPQLIAAVQAALAAVGIGRSLPMPADIVKTDSEERKEELERVLKQLQNAEERFKEAISDREDSFLNEFVKACNNNSNTLLAQIQAFLAALFPIFGRKLDIEQQDLSIAQERFKKMSENRGGLTFTFVNPFATLQAQIQAQITAIQAQIQAQITAFLASLGIGRKLQIRDPETRQLLESLLSGGPSGLGEGSMEQIMQQQFESLLAEMGMNGGIEDLMNEIMAEMGVSNMEEFMNGMMAEMGGMEGMDSFEPPPLQCDCVRSS